MWNSKVSKADKNFYSTDELISWLSKPEVKERIDYLLDIKDIANTEKEHLLPYFLHVLYDIVINYELKHEIFNFNFLPKTNQIEIDVKYDDPNFKNHKWTTLSKEEILESRRIALELIGL